MSKVKEAVKFAVKAHGDQRYGSLPYSFHLDKVYRNTVKFGGSEVHQVVAWLHDTIEDTSVTKADLAKSFGSSVATLVDLVSNRTSKDATYRRIRSNKDAVFVKLCDRLANLQVGEKIGMYRKQFPAFKAALYKKGEFEVLWIAIENRLGI